jgi:hypothetical protein
MEELIRLVSSKAGISEDQARTAVDMVVNYLKQKLPQPIASQIDAVLGQGGPGADALKGLGNILGKK